jgi:hypothetical protein
LALISDSETTAANRDVHLHEQRLDLESLYVVRLARRPFEELIEGEALHLLESSSIRVEVVL